LLEKQSLHDAEVGRISEILEETKQLYKKQVVLHGKDLQHFEAQKKKISLLEQELVDKKKLEENLGLKLQEAEKILEEQKISFKKEIEILNQRLEELNQQNVLLLKGVEGSK